MLLLNVLVLCLLASKYVRGKLLQSPVVQLTVHERTPTSDDPRTKFTGMNTAFARRLMSYRSGFTPSFIEEDAEQDDYIEITGSPSRLKDLDGIYVRTSECNPNFDFVHHMLNYAYHDNSYVCWFLTNFCCCTADWDINNHPHYERRIATIGRDGESRTIHLYWSGKQWVLHYDLNPSHNIQHLLAYAKVKSQDPRTTKSHWYVKKGQTYERAMALTVVNPHGKYSDRPDTGETIDSEASIADMQLRLSKLKMRREIFGVPRAVLPHFAAFMFDAIAVGLAMPLLPFYVMELGANAFQLSIVVSSNYVAQMVGCIIMGKVSDMYGRRVVLLACLGASSLSFFCVSYANSLVQVALARVISGIFGGLLPIMQSSVADSSVLEDRPKYLGRIMATFGLGFVLGPAISALLPGLTARSKIRLAALLPLTGFVIAVLFAQETKEGIRGPFARIAAQQRQRGRRKRTSKSFSNTASDTDADYDSWTVDSNGSNYGEHLHEHLSAASAATAAPPEVGVLKREEEAPLTLEVIFLVLNGFLLMYAFATETIYAMFLKDSFGFGESVLSALFAFNGSLMGLFQVFCIKPLIGVLGKHATLVLGNALLAAGMVGLALVRQPPVMHFFMFAVHIIGYSIADTSLVSLISRYSAPSSQGRDLALNQAAQSCARIFSPLCAGLLYERSKLSPPSSTSSAAGAAGVIRKVVQLPPGALPFLAGGMCPAVAILVPSLLYIRNVTRKRAAAATGASKSAGMEAGE